MKSVDFRELIREKKNRYKSSNTMSLQMITFRSSNGICSIPLKSWSHEISTEKIISMNIFFPSSIRSFWGCLSI